MDNHGHLIEVYSYVKTNNKGDFAVCLGVKYKGRTVRENTVEGFTSQSEAEAASPYLADRIAEEIRALQSSEEDTDYTDYITTKVERLDDGFIYVIDQKIGEETHKITSRKYNNEEEAKRDVDIKAKQMIVEHTKREAPKDKWNFSPI